MNVLSIDTSSEICGVSILDDNVCLCNLDEVATNSHSVCLMPMIKKSLDETNLNLQDIKLFVCDVGPGSFTGIRIGIATIKAFHDSLSTQCVGVNSLESLAYPMLIDKLSNNQDYVNNYDDEIAKAENHLVCSMLDCKNDNCYFALYTPIIGKTQKVFRPYLKSKVCLEPQASNIDSALNILKKYCDENYKEYKITFVGNESVNFKDKILNKLPDSIFAKNEFNKLNSFYVGLTGLSHFYNNDLLVSDNLTPLYLKKPLAERTLEEKNKKLNNSNK